jgi:hypothetical protein
LPLLSLDLHAVPLYHYWLLEDLGNVWQTGAQVHVGPANTTAC